MIRKILSLPTKVVSFLKKSSRYYFDIKIYPSSYQFLQKISKDKFKISQLTSRDTNFQCGTSRLPLSYISQVESMSHHKMYLQRASHVMSLFNTGSCTYYTITFGILRDPSPLCNIVIIGPYPPPPHP